MRYRFIDQIVDLEPVQSIHCIRTWPTDLEIFADHFPGFPVVPGVLLTEMMGQAAGLCIDSDPTRTDSAMLLQIKNAAFKEWVAPGEALDIFATIQSAQAKLARISAKTEKQGKLVAQCELLFTFQDKSKLGLPDIDPLLTEYYDRRTEG